MSWTPAFKSWACAGHHKGAAKATTIENKARNQANPKQAATPTATLQFGAEAGRDGSLCQRRFSDLAAVVEP